MECRPHYKAGKQMYEQSSAKAPVDHGAPHSPTLPFRLIIDDAVSKGHDRATVIRLLLELPLEYHSLELQKIGLTVTKNN